MKKVLLLLLALGSGPAWAQTPTTPAVAALVCANNTVVPTPVSGQFFYVQCDSNGKLITSGSTNPNPSFTTVTIGAGSSITSSGPGGALGSNAFNSTAYLPLAGGVMSGAITYSGIAANTNPLAISGGSITGSSTVTPGISVTGTLNTSGVVDGAVLFGNITNTASGAGTMLVDLKVGGSSKFSVDTTGQIMSTASIISGSAVLVSGAGGPYIQGNGAGVFSIQQGSGSTLRVTLGNTFASATPATTTLQVGQYASGSNVAANTATILTGLSTGTATNPDMVFQTGVMTTSGAGQATPTTALTIKGETQAILTTGTLTVGTVNSTTGLFVCETSGLLSSGITTCVASDRAVKHDIESIQDTGLVDKVLAKHGVRFTYNEGKGAPGRRIGVIANDWEKDFPELVDMDSQGIRHFDYAATWGLTVELFRRQQTEIDHLKAHIH